MPPAPDNDEDIFAEQSDPEGKAEGGGHLGKHWRVVHTSLRQVSSSLCAEVHRKSVSCLSESSCSVTGPREQRSSQVRSQAADEFLVTAPSYLHCLHLFVMNALE